MPGVNFARVREQVSMADVPSSVRGDQLRGPCPVPESRRVQSRSFSVNVRLPWYPCFRCGSRGNALDLWTAAIE